MNLLKYIDKLLLNILKVVSSLCLAATVVFVVIQVVFRYFLKLPCSWAEELARLALVWCVVLASAAGVRLLEHPKLDLLLKRLSVPMQKIITILIYLAIAGFGLVLTIYGVKFTIATSMDFMTSLGFHKNYFYAPSFVGGVLYTVYAISHCIQTILSFRKEKT
jgi:TRAP-type C4-dicarboxylate transport system permease small subunit